MSNLKALPILTTLLILSLTSINAQISTPCTNSMLNTFTPCLNYLTGSIGSSATSPTSNCCETLKSVMSVSMDCACLIITGNVPFSLPINRTLAISLPRACKTQGVPVQCKATGVPLPAPGPVLFGPTAADSPFSPRASKTIAMAPPPVDIEEESPAESPTVTSGIRPVLTPPTSSSKHFYTSSFSQSSIFLTIASLLLRYYFFYNFVIA